MGKETQSRMRANHFRKEEDIYLNVLIDLERGWGLVGNRKELGVLGKGPESVKTGKYDVSSLQACKKRSQPNPLLCIINISYQKHF